MKWGKKGKKNSVIFYVSGERERLNIRATDENVSTRQYKCSIFTVDVVTQ